MLKVGGLGVRWVLMQHADPWLLTVNSKQWSQSRLKSDKLPFLENEHNIPFMRKRCRRETRQETEEPPAKKPAVDRQESKDRVDAEGLPSNVTNEGEQLEKQKEREDEESGDKQLNLREDEGAEQTREEEAGQDKIETEERQEEQTEQRARGDSTDAERAEEACSPQAGLTDVDVE